MIKIEILSDVVNVKRGNAKVTGKPYEIREQIGYAFLVDKDGVIPKYPTKIVVNLEDAQAPYPLGSYTLSPAALYVGDFDQLKIGRVSLVRPGVAKAA